MNKSLRITGVKTIFNIERPIVVFEVQGHEPIVRNPKQALIDLQNSGRALELNVADFAGDLKYVNPALKGILTKALLRCTNATLSGDIKAFKAGDKYEITKGHPALVDKNHPMFNKVKEGDTLSAEKDGVWVEGFLSIPETQDEMLREEIGSQIAKSFIMMYNFAPPAVASTPALIANPLGIADEDENVEDEATAEAIGNKTAKTTK